MYSSENKLPSEIPQGFKMALMANHAAYNSFSILSNERKCAIIDGCRSVKSKDKMTAYVDSIIHKEK